MQEKSLSFPCCFSHRYNNSWSYLGRLLTRYKKQLPEYLSFTRKERTGIIAIIVLIILFIILPFLFPLFITERPPQHDAFEKEIASLNIMQHDSSVEYENRNSDENNYKPSEKKYFGKQPKGELFYFDPNTLSAAEWEKLGIKEKTARTIQNYLSKGGRFNKPEDIGKIWGLHKDEVKRLLPYIQIETISIAGSGSSKKHDTYKAYEKQVYTITPFDINTADTSAFINLPGIGSKLANRIIAFREKLGGFYKIEQVAETFALPDTTFQKIRDKLMLTNYEVKKMNINQATLEELKLHPYLRYNIANAIVQYRKSHGAFTAIHDLKRIMIITDDIYNKAAPYLKVR